jgi:hypothetical protein
MSDEITINERPRKPWTRFEWRAKKKAIAGDLAMVINLHGFDSHFEIPDFLLADVAVDAMYMVAQILRATKKLHDRGGDGRS